MIRCSIESKKAEGNILRCSVHEIRWPIHFNFVFEKSLLTLSERMICWQELSMTIKPRSFTPCFNWNALMSYIQYGQANLPLVPHPNNISYAEKSFIVHIKHARITKFSLVEMSYVKTPSFHNPQ